MKFDERARQLLSSGPYPVLVPPDGSVYDYCLDFSKGGLVKWEERPGAQLKTLPSSYTVITEVRLTWTFTAVKGKKLRHVRSFRALKFEKVQTFTSAKFV